MRQKGRGGAMLSPSIKIRLRESMADWRFGADAKKESHRARLARWDFNILLKKISLKANF